jgi:hypothetical protein
VVGAIAAALVLTMGLGMGAMARPGF